MDVGSNITVVCADRFKSVIEDRRLGIVSLVPYTHGVYLISRERKMLENTSSILDFMTDSERMIAFTCVHTVCCWEES
ncbi:hypothetical protein D3C81_2118070 [compost metagenome]